MNVLKILNSYKSLPKKGLLYAVEGGDFLGEFFLFFDKKNNDYLFLSLPEMFVRKVPKEAFQRGVTNKILVPYKKIPSAIFKICQMQYKHSINQPDKFTNDIKTRGLKHVLNK
jgi:hypothetical protein